MRVGVVQEVIRSTVVDLEVLHVHRFVPLRSRHAGADDVAFVDRRRVMLKHLQSGRHVVIEVVKHNKLVQYLLPHGCFLLFKRPGSNPCLLRFEIKSGRSGKPIAIRRSSVWKIKASVLVLK